MPVPGLTGITQVVAGGASFAVRSDGVLFGWGDNTKGAVGNSIFLGFSSTPVPVPGLTGVTQVASDGDATLAVTDPYGVVWAWGDNQCGQLGDGTTTSQTSPERLP